MGDQEREQKEAVGTVDNRPVDICELLRRKQSQKNQEDKKLLKYENSFAKNRKEYVQERQHYKRCMCDELLDHNRSSLYVFHYILRKHIWQLDVTAYVFLKMEDEQSKGNQTCANVSKREQNVVEIQMEKCFAKQ